MRIKFTFILLGLFILLLGSQAYAHTLFLSLSEIDENSVELEGMYSTGEIASETPVKIYRAKDNKLIWQGKTDDLGSCIFTRPNEPYEVELDGGPGHQAREDGI
ncbi:hypothetical protein [Desulfovibrio sp. UCD-KL4C]|uniref:hypothetical protein n=1 Tax=Desulfovibrio sp. UCD-KL4C TaxID=2578120 RepID=UPI0025C21689|nr:hypothetical protein [Desulfovibrio sp. UCD-KL4C]